MPGQAVEVDPSAGFVNGDTVERGQVGLFVQRLE